MYLTAEASNDLDAVPDGGCFVVGALVDHKAKPGVSHTRAEAVADMLAARPSCVGRRGTARGGGEASMPHARARVRARAARALRAARLPLAQFIDMRSRQSGGGLDVSTFAVVEMLLLWRQTRHWGAAVSQCQAPRGISRSKDRGIRPPPPKKNAAPRRRFHLALLTCHA